MDSDLIYVSDWDHVPEGSSHTQTHTTFLSLRPKEKILVEKKMQSLFLFNQIKLESKRQQTITLNSSWHIQTVEMIH